MCDPVPDQHLLLPGQRDSGPQATFPYHYLQHQDEASTTCNAISHDLEDTDRKIFLKTRESEENHTQFSWGRLKSSSSTPILSSMLATEPSNLRQTGQIPGNLDYIFQNQIDMLIRKIEPYIMWDSLQSQDSL